MRMELCNMLDRTTSNDILHEKQLFRHGGRYMGKILLRTGAVINLVMAFFHMSFWKLLNWSTELPRLSDENSGVFQIANIVLIYVLLYFAVMSYLISKSDSLDFNGTSILICIMGFYLIRILAGMFFFGFILEELVVWAICLLIVVLYGAVIYLYRKT